MFYVYILGSTTKHYVGVTQNIARRIEEHMRGQNSTTAKLIDIFLIGYFIKDSRSEALKLEKIIKKNCHIHHWINHHTFIHADVA